MTFTDPTLENALTHCKKLQQDTKPLWGSLDAIGMIEHLTDSLSLAQGLYDGLKLAIPEEKVPQAKGFLQSEHPLPKNYTAPFGTTGIETRNATLVEAIEEFEVHWNAFESHFNQHPEATSLHPSFGVLNYQEWLRLHSKHLTHHFQQFGLLPV